MQIRYQFTVEKAISLMVALLSRVGPMDKLKLVKLLYFADRDCFLKFGRPITGDELVAMPHGPVPSACLDLLNGVRSSDIFRFIRICDKRVECHPNAREPSGGFSKEEQAIIDETIEKYGAMTTGQLYTLVHKLPEYKKHHNPGTSTTIPFGTILEHYGSEKQFRRGRPVITKQMREHIVCPLPPQT